MATGIRIGWRKLMTLAAAQITAPTMMTRRTTKQAVSAAHIVLRCHGVGYSFMSRSALDVASAHYVGLVLGKSLLILFLVPSTFSARFLFLGSSVSAFCHASTASGIRFSFR